MALLGVMVFPMSTVSQPSPGQAGGPQGARRGEREGEGGRERHPEVRRALRTLQRAKDELKEGAHDFGGHRQKALELTEQAIQECHQALQSDKK